MDEITKAYIITEFIEKIETELSESIIWGIVSDNSISNNDKADKILEYVIDKVNSIACENDH